MAAQTGATNIVQLPLAFVRSGYVITFDGEVDGVGGKLFGWSRTARSTADAYYLGVGPSEVYPSGNNGRYYGLSLRCLYQAKA
ncbi:hypothetical protein D3Z47_21455 [Lachnospiraceae bacterium]|nr:hypothetical protein [Lachnospiraceae bacterium]